MSQKSILITGGAGYIGSHLVKQLGQKGERLVILDNLSTGFRESVLYGDLVVGDTGDSELVKRVLRDYDVESVIHFAAYTVVPESVSNPLKYYGNNTCNTRSLLAACLEHGVKHFIFSSTAAVYGELTDGTASEDTAKAPINAYGMSKLMSEYMLNDVGRSSDLRYTVLRYFNVAGTDLDGEIGQSTPKATLLLKVACEVAVGKRPHISIYGTDYPTPDGTGIRDYIHVVDLANAHVLALERLRQGGESLTLNCGYGHGYSVREMLDMVQRVHGAPITIKEEPRRAGDPPALIAKADLIREKLGWKPQHDDLETIVRTALNWEHRLKRQPAR